MDAEVFRPINVRPAVARDDAHELKRGHILHGREGEQRRSVAVPGHSGVLLPGGVRRFQAAGKFGRCCARGRARSGGAEQGGECLGRCHAGRIKPQPDAPEQGAKAGRV